MKRLIILVLFLAPLWLLAQNGTVIEPKINAQTIEGLDTSQIVTTSLPNHVVGQGTNLQILQTDGSGVLTWVTNAAANGVISMDATNISSVELFRGADTIRESFSHVHTEYALSTTGAFKGVTTVGAATYDLLATDEILHVTYTATAAVTSLTLPTAQVVMGRIVIIKDAGGLAGTNNITIDTEGSAEIDGESTVVINANYNAVTIYCDGTNWFINSKYN